MPLFHLLTAKALLDYIERLRILALLISGTILLPLLRFVPRHIHFYRTNQVYTVHLHRPGLQLSGTTPLRLLLITQHLYHIRNTPQDSFAQLHFHFLPPYGTIQLLSRCSFPRLFHWHSNSQDYIVPYNCLAPQIFDTILSP